MKENLFIFSDKIQAVERMDVASRFMQSSNTCTIMLQRTRTYNQSKKKRS